MFRAIRPQEFYGLIAHKAPKAGKNGPNPYKQPKRQLFTCVGGLEKVPLRV